MKQVIKKKIKEAYNIDDTPLIYTLIIDGNSLLKQSLVNTKLNKDGKEIGGIFTFLLSLRNIINKYDFNFCYCFWDGNQSGVLRYNIYKDYKANRDKHYEEIGMSDYDKKINAYARKVLEYSKGIKKEVKRGETEDESFERQREIVFQALEELFIRQMICDNVEGDDFIGFTKYYKGNYAFKAILPKENADIYEFAAGLTYEDWKKTEEDVYEDSDGMIISFKASARIPEFEFDSNDMNLNDVLIKMGAKDMFNPDLADFSALGSYEDANICCSKVAQKTHIELNRQGTKAAAATRAEMVYTTSVGDFTTKTVNVFLDRPFLYAIVDTQTDLPLFIGIVSQLN